MEQSNEKNRKALDRALERAFDRCNLEDGKNCDIYAVLYRYKAIRELPEAEIDRIYDQFAKGLGFTRG